LYIEDDEYDKLRNSIDAYDKFDHLVLAGVLMQNSLLEFKRIAAYLYKKNNRFAQSIDLYKEYQLYKDAIETAADSKDPVVVESLLRYFVSQENTECFAATLYTCYDFVKPDVALELAWRHKFLDFAMPYLIQIIREYTEKVDNAFLKKKQTEGQPEQQNTPSYVPQFTGPPGSYPPGAYPPGTFPPNYPPGTSFPPNFDQFGRPI